MVTVIVDPGFGIQKGLLMKRMAERNVDCRPIFHPLSSLPAYSKLDHAKAARHRNTVSYAISPFGLNLPSGLNLTEEMVDRVCLHLISILHQGRGA
jgi:perosamine synthetase